MFLIQNGVQKEVLIQIFLLKNFSLEDENRWITLKVSAAGMRVINKKGLKAALIEAKEKGYICRY